ncbi:MAG: BON domain-containing protein [Actinomycetota bacterium]|nr:BON domain-containing protein [Actinomycetota bacterium]
MPTLATTLPECALALTELFRQRVPEGYTVEHSGADLHGSYEWSAVWPGDGSPVIVSLTATPLSDDEAANGQPRGLAIEAWYGRVLDNGSADRRLAASMSWEPPAAPLARAHVLRTADMFLARAFQAAATVIHQAEEAEPGDEPRDVAIPEHDELEHGGKTTFSVGTPTVIRDMLDAVVREAERLRSALGSTLPHERMLNDAQLLELVYIELTRAALELGYDRSAFWNSVRLAAEEGVVKLRGIVREDSHVDWLGERVRSMSEVKGVENELTAAPTSRGAQRRGVERAAGQRSSTRKRKSG